MLSRGVSSILLGLRQRMEREHFPAFFCLIFQRKSQKKHHLTREVMKTTPFPILLGLLLASGLCMVWTNMVLKIRSPTLKTYKMKILSVRLSLTGIFKMTITFFSLTSKQSVDMLLTTCPRLLKVVCQCSICGNCSFKNCGQVQILRRKIPEQKLIYHFSVLLGHTKSGHKIMKKMCLLFCITQQN